MTKLNYWLAASLLPNIGPLTFRQWLSKFSNIEDLFTASESAWLQAGIKENHWLALKSINWQLIEEILSWQQQCKTRHIITFDQPIYPAQLKEVYDAPIILYAQGNINLLPQAQLAIVGSRHPTHAGLENAYAFAQVLSHDLVITSGLALGIDAAAHKGALAAQGKTIAVLGTGLHHIYPKTHIKLAQQIIEQQGLLLSEFPLATLALPYNFPRRNRIISGLSKGVLVVEAALKSGSLITARYANEQGREVFAMPGSIHNQAAKGCHYLLKQGASLVEQVDDILQALNLLKTHSLLDLSSNSPHLPSEHQDLLAQIEYETTAMDVILSRSQLTAGQVSSILLTLELQGHVQAVPGGYIKSSKAG